MMLNSFPCARRFASLPTALQTLVTLCILFTAGGATAGVPLDFTRDIRPILSDKCFACHGPDSEQRQGGFRLDLKESALGEADSGLHPIVPGDPQASELIARITSDDESLRMPPAESTKKLSDEEIRQIKQWIAAGAPWQEHWSFIPPTRPQLPAVQNGDWPCNPIDQFILARLEQEGLSPSAAADKITLLRRVTFDLTGLPPTLEEVDAFIADTSPDAYEKVVDRLLQSARYGEHMARFWLDGARYGDTHGLHLDNYREMWPYRDWVVDAFNKNLPYDQFVIQQLAGDLLPNPTVDQLVATGFNRCHVTTNEGGSIEEEVYVRNVVDRVVTMGTVFMGLTFDCTRCHDHKFDPLTMDDFYSMFGFFNSIDGSPMDGNREDPAPVVTVPTEEQTQQLAQLEKQITEVQKQLAGPWPELDQQQREWEQTLAIAESPERAPDNSEEPATDEVKAGDPEANVKGDEQPKQASQSNTISLGSWYTVGPFAENLRYLKSKRHGPEGKPVKLDDEFKLATGETVRWEKRPEWVDGTPHTDLPGDVAANFLYRKIISSAKQKVTISLGSDDGIKVFLNNKQVLNKDVERSVAADQETLELNLKKGDNDLLVKILNYGGASGFYFAVKSDQIAIPQEVLAIARTEEAKRTPDQQQTLRDFFRNKIAESEPLQQARQELAKLRKAKADVERDIPTTLVFREAAEQKPAFVLKRGEYDQPGKQVERCTPAALPPMKSDLPLNRLGLAQWLVDPAHPLTARVAVNRFWQQVFGTGIVKTAEDFGSQGSPPTHPQLLDWLAVQFIADGWDVKAMMKRIVMSSTYQQSSHVTPDLFRRDPENRLLARGPRFRLDAEMLRDQALFLSGLLVETHGGPSVKPPQPDGLWFAVGYSGSNTVRFVADKGPDKVHRRTLYTFIKRTAPPPQMSTFDAPSREACTIRRERTNTPLQALLLFNDPQYVEAACALAARVMRHHDDTAERARYMFRLCTSRQPSDAELADLVAGFNEDHATYQQDSEAAAKLVKVTDAVDSKGLDLSEWAAWSMTANLLLNLDEVVTKN